MSKLTECTFQVIQILCLPHNVKLVDWVLENGCEERVQELRPTLPNLRKNILNVRVNCLKSRIDASDQLNLCHGLKLVQLALQSCLPLSDLGRNSLWATNLARKHRVQLLIDAFGDKLALYRLCNIFHAVSRRRLRRECERLCDEWFVVTPLDSVDVLRFRGLLLDRCARCLRPRLVVSDGLQRLRS
jgi:hypothetical protein